jgi:hypothetical protein
MIMAPATSAQYYNPQLLIPSAEWGILGHGEKNPPVTFSTSQNHCWLPNYVDPRIAPA